MPLRTWNKTNNASAFFGPHSSNTSQFAPPTEGEAGVWLLNDIDVINATQAVETALGAGNARVLTFRNNATDTGTAVTLAHPDLTVRGLVGGTLLAAAGATPASSNLGRQLDTGSPPTEASRIQFFYRDVTDEQLCWHGFGSPTFNQSISGTEYLGIDQNRTSTVEANARVIVPAGCTVPSIRCRYTSATGTTYELAMMINGVATVIGSLPSSGGASALIDFSPGVALAALDEIDFRIVRTAGSGTQMVILGEVAFKPDNP